MKIGYVRDTYAERRLFINRSASARYVRLDNRLSDESRRFNASELEWSARVDRDSGVDLAHFFNQVNYGTAPWVVTFETNVPRLYRPENFRMGAEALAQDNCKGLIAMSACAMEIHKRDLRAKAPEFFNALEAKSYILHPPQDLIPTELQRFDDIRKLKVIFVSNQFFLKGGWPMLEALIESRSTLDIELHLVTKFALNDNVTMHSSEDVASIRKLIAEHSDWIRLYEGMPNCEVLQLMSECHLGICMSFAETYGYVVLEMQAAGVPVITTNIRAFPEINNDDIGWLLDYPYRYGRLPRDATKVTVDEISFSLKNQLLGVLESIRQDGGNLLKTKAILAREKIASMHDPIAYGQKLTQIYES